MIHDESPADITAQNAAPPTDDSTRQNTDAHDSSATAQKTTRKRATTSRSARPRKNTETTIEPTGIKAEPSALVSADIASSDLHVTTLPEETATPNRKRRYTRKKSLQTMEAPASGMEFAAEASQPATVDIIPADPVVHIEASAEDTGSTQNKRTARRGRPRKKPLELNMAPQLSLEETLPGKAIEIETPVAIENVISETASSNTKLPARRGRPRKNRTAEAPAAATGLENPAAAGSSLNPSAVETTAENGADSQEQSRPSDRTRRRRTVRRKPDIIQSVQKNGARLVVHHGLPELQINGQTYPPVFFFGNVEGLKESRRVVSEIQRAAKAGVHLHSTIIELPSPLPPDDSVFEKIDERIRTLLEADAEGFILPRIVFIPAPGWRRQYPNEVIHYADGSTGDPSVASERFWTEAENSLDAVVKHILMTNYADRVIGYHLERGEWFHPSENGYDRSFANREAFRAWLRAKYKNSEASLRAAWYDSQVQFYTVEIPSMPAAPRKDIAFFEPRKDRRWIDFLQFTSEITAERLISLSKVVKQASENTVLVSVCYGYTFEFVHTFSGHLALGKLLSCTTIDLIAGPPSYRDRLPGGAGSFPCPSGSMAVHGKLWVSESDTKTHMAPPDATPDDFNPRMESRFATEQVQLRSIGRSLLEQNGISFMDLWGEGWLDTDEIWRPITEFTDRYKEILRHRTAISPDVVVMVDERSLPAIQRGPEYIKRILRDQRDMFQHSGASVEFYLQSDVTAKNFPTNAKLYIFLNPWRVPMEQRAAIKEKLQRDGKILVWMYSTAIFEEKGEPEERLHDITGITLRQQSWNSEMSSHLLDTRHPITEGIKERQFGVKERINPSFYVDDEDRDVVILAEYNQSGLPSMAARKMDGWRSVFCGEVALTQELFRGLCRYAGAHLFTSNSDDYVFAGNGMMMLIASRDGQRNISVPRGNSLYDILDRRLVAEDGRDARLFLKARTTNLYYVAPLDVLRKMGLPGIVEQIRPRQGHEHSAPLERVNPPAAPTSIKPEAEDRSPISEGLKWIEEIATMPLPPDIEYLPTDDPAIPLYDPPIELPDSILDDSSDIPFYISQDSADEIEDQDMISKVEIIETEAEAALRSPRRRRGGRGRGRRYRPAGGGNTPSEG